jgi:acyl dehydratase
MNPSDILVAEQPGSIHNFTAGPISRTDIALYAGGSGDYNGIHVDIDFARRAGLPDVIVHGMYSMGLLSRLLTRLTPAARVLEIQSRFQSMVAVGSTLRCESRVLSRTATAEGDIVELALAASLPDGTEVTTGSAKILIPTTPGQHGDT